MILLETQMRHFTQYMQSCCTAMTVIAIMKSPYEHQLRFEKVFLSTGAKSRAGNEKFCLFIFLTDRKMSESKNSLVA